MKKKILAFTLVAALSLATTAVFADSPSEIFASITGKTVEDAYEMRGNGQRFGQLAADEDKLEEFKEAMQESRKELIEERVEAGTLTEEQAEEYLALYEERIESCDGTQNGEQLGKVMGMHFGAGNGNGNGEGLKLQDGTGGGQGRGNGGGRGFGNAR